MLHFKNVGRIPLKGCASCLSWSRWQRRENSLSKTDPDADVPESQVKASAWEMLMSFTLIMY